MIPLVLADLVTQLFKLKVLDFSCPAVQLHSNPNEPKPSFNAFKKQQKANHSNILEDNEHTTFDYLILWTFWLSLLTTAMPCHLAFTGSKAVFKSAKGSDFCDRARNMATKKLWKWHAIAAIPHLLRLLFLHLGARAPKTSQLMTHRSPQKPPPKPWTKVLYQTGTKASCTVLSHNQDSILWRNMIAFHIYSTDPPMFAQRLHTLVEND